MQWGRQRWRARRLSRPRRRPTPRIHRRARERLAAGAERCRPVQVSERTEPKGEKNGSRADDPHPPSRAPQRQQCPANIDVSNVLPRSAAPGEHRRAEVRKGGRSEGATAPRARPLRVEDTCGHRGGSIAPWERQGRNETLQCTTIHRKKEDSQTDRPIHKAGTPTPAAA